jgi:hypothetical protein
MLQTITTLRVDEKYFHALFTFTPNGLHWSTYALGQFTTRKKLTRYPLGRRISDFGDFDAGFIPWLGINTNSWRSIKILLH